MKLALGTVQFGLDYGVANAAGRVAPAQAAAILAQARSHGIDTLDTAAAYGDSESVLGEVNVDGWHVISKLPPQLPDGVAGESWVRQSVDQSLRRMRLDSLHGILLHRPDQLLGPSGEAVYGCLQKLKAEGVIGRVGISVYGPGELESLFRNFDFDLVQAPLSVFDRRLLTSGWAQQLADRDVELHVRSVFLQGLLLMPEAGRPPRFRAWGDAWRAWHGWLEESQISAAEACIRFAVSCEGVAKVVVGVQTCGQLDEIVAAVARGPLDVPASLAVDSEDLLNPARWAVLA